MTRKFAFKLLFYCLFVLYLVGDLHVWHGFLSRYAEQKFRAQKTIEGDDSEVIAYVYGEPISKRQVAHKKAEMFFLEGIKKGADGSYSKKDNESGEIRATMELVRGSLLRLKTLYNEMSLPDTKERATEEVNSIASRFGGENDSFIDALIKEQSDLTLFTNMVAGRLKQEEQLEDFLKDAVPVSDEDMRYYYDEIKNEIKIPQRRTLKHIFLATLDKDADAVGKQAESLVERLKNGESFSALAKEFSDDSATASKGGNLGLVTAARPNILGGVNLFELPANELCLKRSKIGWHIFMADAILPERVPSFEEALPSIKTALYGIRRDKGVTLYLDNALKDARINGRIWVKQP